MSARAPLPAAPRTATTSGAAQPAAPPRATNWLTELSSQRRAVAAASTTQSSAAPGRDTSKRLSLGKRKLAEADAELQRGARAAAAQLCPPTPVLLGWIASRDEACTLAFLWRFLDGSTSARPHPRDGPFDPYAHARVAGCSIYTKRADGDEGDGDGGGHVDCDDGEVCHHIDLRDGAAEPEMQRRAWVAVARLLSGEHGCILVVPNAQLVARTLLLALPWVVREARRPPQIELAAAAAAATTTADDRRDDGDEELLPRLLRDTGVLNVERWVDPIVAAWLCDPDLSEEDQQLPRLYAKHLPADADAPTSAGDATSELRSCWALLEQLFELLSRGAGALAAAQAAVAREMRVAAVLAAMELAGIAAHPPTLKQPLAAVDARSRQLTREAEALLGRPILLSSPQQVSEALYVSLKLPPPRLGPGETVVKAGHGSTADAALQALVRTQPQARLPAMVLQFRELNKLRTAFLEPYLERVIADGRRQSHQQHSQHHHLDDAAPAPAPVPRLFCCWQQTAVGTGRLSCRSPNLQQVPRSATTFTTADGETLAISVREALVAPPGHLLISADYNQLEVRLFAALSKDPTLQRELRGGGDLFRRLAAMWLKLPDAEVTPAQRSTVKAMTYGLLYGLGVERLAEQLTEKSDQPVGRDEAAQMRTTFLKSFPTLTSYMTQLKANARRQGKVVTAGGRHRLLPHLASTNGNERARAERQAINSTIQGSAADVMKEAMLRCRQRLHERGLRAVLLAQIHDELLFEVPAAQLRAAASCVKTTMETIQFEGSVHGPLPPLPVSVVSGATWGHMQTLELSDE